MSSILRRWISNLARVTVAASRQASWRKKRYGEIASPFSMFFLFPFWKSRFSMRVTRLTGIINSPTINYWRRWRFVTWKTNKRYRSTCLEIGTISRILALGLGTSDVMPTKESWHHFVTGGGQNWWHYQQYSMHMCMHTLKRKDTRLVWDATC